MSFKNNINQGGASKSTLFLGDLSSVCTEDDIEKVFAPYGKIRHIRIQRSPGSFSSLGYGFIRMGSQIEAMQAKEELNGILICGRKVRIREAAFGVGGETANKPPPKNSLFVRFSGVDRYAFTNEAIIREIYSSIGTISDVSIRESKYDKKTGIQKGYGFVHFDESSGGTDGVEAALNAVVNTPQMLIDNVLYICEVSRNLQAQLNNSSDKTRGGQFPGNVNNMSSASSNSVNNFDKRGNYNSNMSHTYNNGGGNSHQYYGSGYDPEVNNQSNGNPQHMPYYNNSVDIRGSNNYPMNGTGSSNYRPNSNMYPNNGYGAGCGPGQGQRTAPLYMTPDMDPMSASVNMNNPNAFDHIGYDSSAGNVPMDNLMHNYPYNGTFQLHSGGIQDSNNNGNAPNNYNQSNMPSNMHNNIEDMPYLGSPCGDDFNTFFNKSGQSGVNRYSNSFQSFDAPLSCSQGSTNSNTTSAANSVWSNPGHDSYNNSALTSPLTSPKIYSPGGVYFGNSNNGAVSKHYSQNNRERSLMSAPPMSSSNNIPTGNDVVNNRHANPITDTVQNKGQNSSNENDVADMSIKATLDQLSNMNFGTNLFSNNIPPPPPLPHSSPHSIYDISSTYHQNPNCNPTSNDATINNPTKGESELMNEMLDSMASLVLPKDDE